MKTLSLGNESIAFQNDAYFKDLTLIIQDYRESQAKTDDELQKVSVRLDMCTSKHTGITTSSTILSQGNGSEAFIAIPSLTRGNVLSRASVNKYLDKNFSAENISFYMVEKKGWIDPANARIGGAFSEIMFKLFMSKQYLSGSDGLGARFSCEEVASIIMHEVGHAFTFIQFLADTIIVNAVLQRACQEVMNANVDAKVKIILTRAADDMGLKDREWLEAIEPGTDKISAFRVLVSAVQIEPRAMDNKRYFAKDQAEELADIFAVRHGAGRALITARAKFKYQSSSYPYLRTIGWALSGFIAAPILPWVGIPVAIISSLRLVGLVGKNLFDAAFPDDLPTFKQEATKIRNQFVEQIKASKLPKEDLAEIIESINLTDKIIQGYTGDFDPSVLSKFVDMFRRGKMDLRNSREYTNKLENLASNDLFIRSAQLGARADSGS